MTATTFNTAIPAYAAPLRTRPCRLLPTGRKKRGSNVTFSPKCSGSISDAYVQAHPDQFGGKQVAEEDMLTADMLQWNIKAEVGQKFSKQFAQQKSAQKVRVTSTANVVDADEEPAAEPGNGGNGGSNPPSGGGENEE